MNGFFITVGCVIIAILAALLIGPHFVDWTQHRAWFEREASTLLGAPVRVDGAIDLELLPQPILRFEDVTVGDARKARVRGFTLTLATSPLLRGELRATQLAIDGARVEAAVNADGGVSWPTSGRFAGAHGEKTVLESVSVTNAQILLADRRSGETTVLEAVNFEGSARSLSGPFKAEGGFRFDGRPHLFRISTSRVENAAIRFKASGSRSDTPVTLELEGALNFAEAKPKFDGRAILTRPPIRNLAGLPWRLDAQVKADPEGAVVEKFELAYGPEDQRAVLAGTGRRTFGAESRLEATLSARQVDLDRLFGEDDAPASVGSRLARLVEIAPILAEPPKEASVRLDVAGLVVGGGVVSGLRLDLAAQGDGWSVKSLEATLPGTSPLRLSGALDLTPDKERFEGEIRLNSQNFSALRGWIAGPGDAAKLAFAPARLEARSRLSVSNEGLLVDDLALSLADARLSGRFEYRAGRLDAALAASRLDLDRLLPEETRRRGLSLLTSLPVGLEEAAVRLDADALTVAGVRAEDVSTAVRLAGDALSIERFSVSRLGGASIQAAGQVVGLGGAPDGRIDITANADDLSALTRLLLATEGAHAVGEALEQRRAALAPLNLTAILAFTPENGGAAGRLTINGTAGGSSLEAEAALAGAQEAFTNGTLSLRTALTNPSATRILEQLGVPVLPIQSLAPGELALNASGPLNGEIRVEAHLDGFGTRLAVAGALRPFAEGPPAELTLTGESQDLAALAPVLGFGLPDPGARLPLTLSARLSQGRDRAWKFEDMTGELAGARFGGDLALTPGERLGLNGAIETSDLDLRAFIAAGLGGDLAGLDGTGLWSDASFNEPALSRFDGEVSLRGDRAVLVPGLDLTAARARLAFHAEGFAVRDFEAHLAGGTLRGTLEGRKFGEGARRVSLRASLEQARLEELVWRASGRPVAAGTLTLSAELEADGRSPSGLWAHAIGNGSLRVENGEVRGLNPLAFASILRAADAGLELKEDRVREVFSGHLASGVIAVDRAEGAFAVSGGVARLRNLGLENETATSLASARLDLSTMEIESDWSLAVKTPIEGAERRAPPVSLLFRGPLSAPARSVEVSALLGFLNVRAFEKEVERLEALQAEILERERLTRELVRLGERRRERERLAEERRKAEEEARAKAAAEPVPVAPADPDAPAATGGPRPLLPPSILAPVPQSGDLSRAHPAPARRRSDTTGAARVQPQPRPQPAPRQAPTVLERLFGVSQ